MDQMREAWPRGPAFHLWGQIAGQAPSGVKGLPEASHRFAPQERVETQDRGIGPDLVGLIDQQDRIGALRDVIGQTRR